MATTKASKKARQKARIKSAAWRCARTFLAGFIGAFTTVSITTGLGDLKKFAIAGLSGGIAGLVTLALRWLDYSKLPSIPPG